MSHTRLELLKRVTSRLLVAFGVCILGSASILITFLVFRQPVNMLIVSFAFGVLGGFVSIQRRIRRIEQEELELLSASWPFVYLAPLTGGVLAGILYILFISGMVSGELFPTFLSGDESIKDFSRLLDCTAENYTDYAKTIIWSFIAGFSESFVTNILGGFSNTKDRLEQNPTATP